MGLVSQVNAWFLILISCLNHVANFNVGLTREDPLDEDECTAGEHKKVKCNVCVCGDGNWVCSNDDCRKSRKEGRVN